MLGSGSESDEAAAQAHKRQLLLGTLEPDANGAAAAAAAVNLRSVLPPAASRQSCRLRKQAQKKPKNRCTICSQ